MEQIIVSACLLGEPVRYDGKIILCSHPVLIKWLQEGRLIPFCPEVKGGLPVPRFPAEIQYGDGGDIIFGNAGIVNNKEEDVTRFFIDGAKKALQVVLELGIKLAILKEGSPSCGSSYIYDGSFSGVRISGKGVTSALFEQNNIRVFSERGIRSVEKYLN